MQAGGSLDDTVAHAIVAVAGVNHCASDHGSFDGGQNRRRGVAARMVGEKLPQESDVQPDTIVARGTGHDAVEVSGYRCISAYAWWPPVEQP